jgi:hypothetical protein
MISGGLALALVLSARPVQPAFRGELESLDFTGHVTGVVATFAENTPVATGKAAIDACAPGASGQATVSAAFLHTPKAKLAAILPPVPATAKSVLALANCLSKQKGVAESHAWFFPRAESGVEVEGVWRFRDGARVERTLRAFRDDPTYVKFVRRTVTRPEYFEHVWKEPFPLSELARTLGLGGRESLERQGALLWEGAEWPTDAGDNLARVQLFLPKGTALSLLQEAETSHHSTSKLVAEALLAAKEAKALNQAGEDPAQGKSKSVVVWLPWPLLAELEDIGDAEGLSLSSLVQHAWERAHGEKEKQSK